jgi:hypothetical protein
MSAVFPPNWAGFVGQPRVILSSRGLRFIGLLIGSTAAFWAGFLAGRNNAGFGCLPSVDHAGSFS